MKKIKRTFFTFCLVLFIFLQIIPDNVQAGYLPFDEINEAQSKLSYKNTKEKNLDEILGPEDNFPFLPDNHRDSSNPIGRIGKITEVP
ncbi:hypothetical protein [Prochlorococcus sp. MIT 1223]|uniref:hypothetical protein n=1 Tax=Prochlorococcus sp. MIT 1223 TaxID=3096217 RepID=UPI002A75A6C1|nr:hypothetical protein [Prochlorococcus sp. MIT 1223]